MPNTPLQDAVDFIYDALKSRTPGAVAGTPHADLVALGVVKVAKNEPNVPYPNFINVVCQGGRELEPNGLHRVDILVDVWSSEMMTTAIYAPPARFTERVETILALIRGTTEGSGVDVEDMSYPMNPTGMDTQGGRKYFYNCKITVPVIIGGGV